MLTSDSYFSGLPESRAAHLHLLFGVRGQLLRDRRLHFDRRGSILRVVELPARSVK